MVLAVLVPRARHGSRFRLGGERGRLSDGMTFWRKKTEKQVPPRGVARVAAAGASREELLREVLNGLIAGGNVDRLGVWVAGDMEPSRPGEAPGILQGLVWDREIVETPKEWSRISVE